MNKKLTYKELEEKVKILEQSTSITNSFLKKLFNTIPNPMFYKDKNGVYLHCNDSFSKTILGIEKEKIIGKTLYDLPDLIPKEYADIYYEKDKELFVTAKEQFYEGKVLCADAVIRDYHFYKSSFVVEGKILGLVGIMLDVSDYKRALLQLDEKNKILNGLSITDHLTELYNRRYFQDVFEKKINLLHRYNHKFSFALLDIDFFKDYNDCNGHHQGDKALQCVSKLLKETLNRQSDYIFRVGGEEFAVLFEVDSENSAFSIMENLRKKVEQLEIKSIKEDTINNVTISIGLGNIQRVNKDTPSSIIYDEVDKLLYSSKRNGRNQITFSEIII